MTKTITIDGREVIITFDPATGITTATFPDIHLDNLNPNDQFQIVITPAQTFAGVIQTLAQVLALIGPR